MATKDKEKDLELESEHDDESRSDETESDSEDADEGATEASADEADDEERSESAPPDEPVAETAAAAEDAEPEVQATQMGSTRYVHAAFFTAGILAAYLSGKILYTIWNALAEWPAAVRALPQLLRYAEDERETFTMIAGAIIGVIVVVQTYRKSNVRRWANDVASELAKVTWPAKEIVTNGTIVVVVASAIATIYISLLDRLWGYLSNLVYGA